MGFTPEEARKINLEHAMKAMHKFNYFFVSLNFSVLALAINHGFNTDLVAPQIVGLVGWLFLLGSGFFGLSVISNEGAIFIKQADIIKFELLRDNANQNEQVRNIMK